MIDKQVLADYVKMIREEREATRVAEREEAMRKAHEVAHCHICGRPKIKISGGCIWYRYRLPCRPVKP